MESDTSVPIERAPSASASQDTITSNEPTYKHHRGYGSSWMQAALRSRFTEEADAYDPHQELTRYLAAPLEKLGSDDDPVRWWGVRHPVHS